MNDEKLDQLGAGVREALHQAGLCHCAVVMIIGEPDENGVINGVRTNHNCGNEVAYQIAKNYVEGYERSR